MSSSLRFRKFLSGDAHYSAGEAASRRESVFSVALYISLSLSLYIYIYIYSRGGRATFYTIIKGLMLSRGERRAGKRVRSLVIRNLCTSSRSCYSNVTPPLRRPVRIALPALVIICDIYARDDVPSLIIALTGRAMRGHARLYALHIKNQPLHHPIASSPLRRSVSG